MSKATSKRVECAMASGSGDKIRKKREQGIYNFRVRPRKVNCAECQRRKLKCDRKIPCCNCQDGTRSKLCPHGTSQGTQFVLAHTESLQRHIGFLHYRISQLEEVLATLHAVDSSDPHPLLCESSWIDENEFGTDDQTGASKIGVDSHHDGPGQEISEINDGFGILSISNHGVSRFFGATGQIECLLRLGPSAKCLYSPENLHVYNLEHEGLFSLTFPFPFICNGQTADTLRLVETYLPPYDRAQALCRLYFARAVVPLFTLTEHQIFVEMLPAIYSRQFFESSSYIKRSVQATIESYSGPHDVALLFSALAIGSLLEFDLSTAEHFHQLSIAALMIQSVLEKPSLSAIQTLQLMSYYNGMAGSDPSDNASMELTWSLRVLATQLSHAIGLHRDCSKWGMSKDILDQRQVVFWDLFRSDVRESLAHGRPPVLLLEYIDCPYPRIWDSRSAFQNVLCLLAAELGAPVVALTQSESPSYEKVIEMDKKIRHFSYCKVKYHEMTTINLESAVTSGKAICQLYLHRAFFMRAIMESQEPLKGRYAMSFLATYRAASCVLDASCTCISSFPVLWSKSWLMWPAIMLTAVVFGTVAVKAPRSLLAVPATAELEKAFFLIENGSEYSKHAMMALTIISRLRKKAQYARAVAHSSSEFYMEGLPNHDDDNQDDEFTFLSGGSRLLKNW